MPYASGSAEVTPEKGNRPAVVMQEIPSTQQQQTRPGMVAPQPLLLRQGTQEAAELVKRSQVLEEARRDMLTTSIDDTEFLQAMGHHEVIEMIKPGY